MHSEYICILLVLLTSYEAAPDDDAEVNITEMVRNQMDTNETQTFLASFPNLNQRSVIEHQLRYCPFTDLCGRFSLLSGQTLKYGARPCCDECSCDISTCHVFNSCCPDVKKLPPNSTLEFGETTMECHLLHLYSHRKFKQESAYMFTSCPKGSNKTVQKLCGVAYDDDDVSHFSDILPVTRINDSRVYRNKYCAFCNSLTDNEIKHWNSTMLSCLKDGNIDINTGRSEKSVIKDILMQEKCDVKFEPGHKMIKEDCQLAISSCNETGLWKTYDPFLEEACSFYKTPQRLRTKLDIYYDNVFCMLCNGVDPTNNYKCLKGSTSPSVVLSFHGLLNFDFFTDSAKQYQPGQCDTESIFDPFQSSCIHTFCSSQRQLKNGECFKLHPKIQWSSYEAYVRVKPISVLTLQTAHALASQILTWLRLHIEELFPWPTYEYYDCRRQLIYKVDQDFTNGRRQIGIKESKLLYYDIKIQFVQAYLHDPETILKEIKRLDNTSKIFKFDNDTFTFTVSLRDDTGYMFEHFMNVSLAKYKDKDMTGVDAILLDMTTEAKASELDGKVILPHLQDIAYDTRCEYDRVPFRLKLASIKSCPMFNISYRQFRSKYTTDGILFVQSGYVLKHSDFYYIDDSADYIGVCSEIYFKFAETINTSNGSSTIGVDSRVGIACMSVSIFSLLLTTATYLLFPPLRAVPGKNNMFLVVSLLIAQTMYIIGNFGPVPIGSVACKVVGAGVHLCWLHYMCWMHACTIHVLHLIYKNKHTINEWNGGRLCVYHAYSTLTPLLIIAATIAISIASSEYDDIGYGETVCDISSRKMTDYMLGLPVAIVVLTNVVMFLLTVYKVKMGDETQKLGKLDKRNLVILAKITTLTGGTWAFSFIYSWTNVAVVWYTFIVLNACQGLYLFLSFALNKQVLDMCFEKMFGEPRTHYDDTDAKSSSDNSE